MSLKKKVFKSIAADSGSEFMDFDGIEKNRDGEKRTELYFCSSLLCLGKRNENHNRMFRRFFVKKSLQL